MHVFAYQRLVPPHLALMFSVQQMAPAHWEKQQAVLILHPPQFLLLLAKISEITTKPMMSDQWVPAECNMTLNYHVCEKILTEIDLRRSAQVVAVQKYPVDLHRGQTGLTTNQSDLHLRRQG